MLPRVWAPDLDPAEKRARLSADESAHLTRVLRLRVGARVLVFDGRGAQYAGELISIAKPAGGVGARAGSRSEGGSAAGSAGAGGWVTLALGEAVPAAAEPRVTVTLAQAVLKGDKMDAVVRDATMLGVSSVIPLITDRTVVPLSAMEQGRVVDRWHRVAVASAKQCGRAVVPEIAAPRRLTTWLAAERAPERTPERTPPQPPGEQIGALRLQLVEPSAAASRDLAEDPLPAEPPPRVLIAIGPEGGWSPDETAAAQAAGYQPWTLGARTLRAESAPLAALAVLTYVWHL